MAPRKQQSVNRNRQRRTDKKGPDDSIHHLSNRQEVREQSNEDIVERGDYLNDNQSDVDQLESEDTRAGLWICSTPNTNVEPLPRVDI